MPKAYVMITSDKGFGNGTIEKLKKIEGVKAVEMVYGVYDIIVTVQVRSMKELEKTVIGKIRNVESVSHTLTMLVAGQE